MVHFCISVITQMFDLFFWPGLWGSAFSILFKRAIGEGGSKPTQQTEREELEMQTKVSLGAN